MQKFITKVKEQPCWEKMRRLFRFQGFEDNGEVMYVVIASLLMHARLRGHNGWTGLRHFAEEYRISHSRQQELFRVVERSGWNAAATIHDFGDAKFINSFIDMCLYDKKIQQVEFRLLFLVGRELGLDPRKDILPQARKRLESLQFRAIVFFERPAVSAIITFLIILNALQLGLLTYDWMAVKWGGWLNGLDTVFMGIFSLEILCRIFAFRRAYFKEPQNLFDFIIILISWVPVPGFRWISAFRVFRAMLLFNRLSQLKVIMKSLLDSLPNIGWVTVLLLVFYYVFAVVTTNLFGADFPMFHTIPDSFFSLFQLMTLEGWPDLVGKVMERYPCAWMVFVPFMLFTSYVLLNLVIGIIVTAMQEINMSKNANAQREIDEIKELKEELRELSFQVANIRDLLNRGENAEPPAPDPKQGHRLASGIFPQETIIKHHRDTRGNGSRDGDARESDDSTPAHRVRPQDIFRGKR